MKLRRLAQESPALPKFSLEDQLTHQNGFEMVPEENRQQQTQPKRNASQFYLESFQKKLGHILFILIHSFEQFKYKGIPYNGGRPVTWITELKSFLLLLHQQSGQSPGDKISHSCPLGQPIRTQDSIHLARSQGQPGVNNYSILRLTYDLKNFADRVSLGI